MMNDDRPATGTKRDNNVRNLPLRYRIHHDWKFWVVVALMLLAMATYLRGCFPS